MTPERCDLAAKLQFDKRGDQFPGHAWLCQYDIGSATCVGKKVEFDPQDSRDACWELLDDAELASSSASPRPERTSWPELVGKSFEEAKAQIMKDRIDIPEDKITDHALGEGFTTEFDHQRVRVFIDENDEVALRPKVS